MPSTSKALICTAQLSGHGFIESVSSQSSALFAPLRLELDDRTEEMRRAGHVLVSEEPSIQTRPLVAGLLENLGRLFRVGIDRDFAERGDELIEVGRQLTLLHGIGLDPGASAAVGNRCARGTDE